MDFRVALLKDEPNPTVIHSSKGPSSIVTLSLGPDRLPLTLL